MSLIPILTVVFIVILSLLITKIAAAMLAHTGLSEHAARFQARSAFTGVGFTTSESEQITRHPSRRKIISSLMLLGNAGIVTVMTSLLLTFVHKDEAGLPWYYGVGILAGAIILLAIVASSNRINRLLTNGINWGLKRFSRFSTREYSSLYKLAGGYHLYDLHIREGDRLIGKTASGEEMVHLGLVLLGIEKPDGTYIGTIPPETVIQLHDTLILYGKEKEMHAMNRKGSAD